MIPKHIAHMIVLPSDWPILGVETISIPKHRDLILLILGTVELQYQLNLFHTVDSCWHAEPILGQMGIFVVSKNIKQIKQQIKSPGIKYRKQLVSRHFYLSAKHYPVPLYYPVGV